MTSRHVNALVYCSCAALALVALGLAGPLYATLLHRNLDGRLFSASMIIVLWGVVVCGAAWLLGLASAARDKQWDWFVLVLALGPLGTLLYGLLTTASAREAY